MRLLDRLSHLVNPRLPPIETATIPARQDLTAAAAAAMERYASVATALADYQVGRAAWPAWDTEQGDRALRNLALIYRCVHLISHAVGTARVRVYDEADDDKTIPDHPMRRLIRQPNRWMGEARFWSVVALRAAAAGFCVVEKERNGINGVIALNPLRSAWLKAIPRGRGAFDWEYRIPGVSTVYTLKAADVVVFPWADSPDGSPYGMAPIATCLRDITILDRLTNFLAVLFERGGVPQWMLFPKLLPGQTLEQAEIDAMTEAFVQRRGGFDKRAVPWIASGFDRAERLSYDPNELAMVAVRDISDLAICQAFGVPPRKAGARVGLEHTTQNATASVEDGEFYRDTIVSLWSRFDDALTTSLLPDFEEPGSTISLEFDTSDVQALQEDRNAKALWVIPAFNASLLRRHQAMTELGIPIPDDEPDYYVSSIATERIPVKGILSEPTPSATTTPPPQLGIELPIYALGDGTFLVGGKRAVREEDARTLAAASASHNGHHGPSERLAAIGTQNRKAHLAIAKARQPSIAAFFEAQGERVLAKVTLSAHLTERELVALPRDVIEQRQRERLSVANIDWKAEEKLLLKTLEKLYLLAGETSWANAAEHLGTEISWDLANSKVRAVMDQLAKNVKGITDESKDKIAEIVTRAAEAGKTIDQLKDDLKGTFQGWSEHRAETVALTESAKSYGLASHAAYEESGVVDRIQMFDNSSHTTDPLPPTNTTCADRDGKIVPLSETERYLDSMHPRCVMAIAPLIDSSEGE